MSDILGDPVTSWQHKHYIPLVLVLALALPTVTAWYLANGTLSPWESFLVIILAHLLRLHGTWTVNSIAHLWGHKTYDKLVK